LGANEVYGKLKAYKLRLKQIHPAKKLYVFPLVTDHGGTD
jgi:hypothetical protein